MQRCIDPLCAISWQKGPTQRASELDGMACSLRRRPAEIACRRDEWGGQLQDAPIDRTHGTWLNRVVQSRRINREHLDVSGMSTSSPPDVTQLLVAWNRGDSGALERLMPLVYDELRRVARRSLRYERPDHTLSASALVHEAYLRLVDQSGVPSQNRAQFFGIAAHLMRQILVQHARRRQAAKRGGAFTPWQSMKRSSQVSRPPWTWWRSTRC